jgi:hypothetical protein
VEIKDGSLTWFYGDSDPTFASWQGKELRVHIDEVMTNFAITVLQTSYFFEVRSQGCTKSRILDVLLHRLSQTQRYPDHSLPSFVLSMSSDLGRPTIFQATSTAFQQKLDDYKQSVKGLNTSSIGSSITTSSTATSTGTILNDNTSESIDVASTAAKDVSLLATTSGSNNKGTEDTNSNSSTGGSPDQNSKSPIMNVSIGTDKVSGSGAGSGSVGGGLASVGVFNCFYGPQKDRDATDADFYVEAESDLRTLLRGIAKLSESEQMQERDAIHVTAATKLRE